MTTQKEFKKRVRARMAKTGEAYMAARAAILTEKIQAIEKCTACNGFGYTKGAPGAPWEKVDCKSCGGRGTVTEAP